MCHDNLWGLVSEEGWTDTDAQVVCTQLGYESEGIIIIQCIVLIINLFIINDYL